jgi:hypothetical protein
MHVKLVIIAWKRASNRALPNGSYAASTPISKSSTATTNEGYQTTTIVLAIILGVIILLLLGWAMYQCCRRGEGKEFTPTAPVVVVVGSRRPSAIHATATAV